MPCSIELRPRDIPNKTAFLCAWAKEQDDDGNYISKSSADKYFRLEKYYRDRGYNISDGMCPYHEKLENRKLDKLKYPLAIFLVALGIAAVHFL